METITRENAKTYTEYKALIDSITEGELVAHVLNVSEGYRLGFTSELALEFIQELKEKETNGEIYDKGKYFWFVAFYLSGLVSDYNWRAWDYNKRELENWKFWKNNEKKEEASAYRAEIDKKGFKSAFLEYYKTQDLDELNKKIYFSRYNDAEKTLSKIDNKLKTKSHSLEKIEKLIDDEINLYWREKAYKETDEERAEYQRILKSAGFTE